MEKIYFLKNISFIQVFFIKIKILFIEYERHDIFRIDGYMKDKSVF